MSCLLGNGAAHATTVRQEVRENAKASLRSELEDAAKLLTMVCHVADHNYVTDSSSIGEEADAVEHGQEREGTPEPMDTQLVHGIGPADTGAAAGPERDAMVRAAFKKAVREVLKITVIIDLRLFFLGHVFWCIIQDEVVVVRSKEALENQPYHKRSDDLPRVHKEEYLMVRERFLGIGMHVRHRPLHNAEQSAQ